MSVGTVVLLTDIAVSLNCNEALGTEFKKVSSVADLDPFRTGQLLPTNLPFCSQLSPASVLIGTVYLFWALIKSGCRQMVQSHLPRQ